MLKYRWSSIYPLDFISSHIVDYPTPLNLSYFWSFGSAAGLCLGVQILSGIFITMHYDPNINAAFESVEHIMRDVEDGWFLRYLHANGASMFFIVVYIHIFRGIFFGSYVTSRSSLWISGILIFFAMMACAFLGYVLPWGQMSVWGATVITNMFSAIPYVGVSIVEWLWGGFAIENAALNRFFAIHFIIPFVIVALVLLHLSLLHKVGSGNPIGIDNKGDFISFYPYFYVKDLAFFLIFLFVLTFLVLGFPNILGHSDNYILANQLVTPAHIVPEWYFLPFYAILRSIPSKLGGVIAMIGAILVLICLPFFNFSKIRNTNFRPFFTIWYWLIVGDFLILGWIGQQPVESPFIEIGMTCTLFYFSFFFIIFPLIGFLESLIITQILNTNSPSSSQSPKSTSLFNFWF